MNSTLLRILMLGTELMLGLMMTGCADPGQNLSASPSNENGTTVTPVASFAQFSDIPVPIGATMDMEHSLLLGAGNEWTGRLTYTTSTSKARVFDLYKAEMPKFGWTELTMIRGDRSIMTYQQGARVATVQIQGGTIYGATVAVTVSPTASEKGASFAPGVYGGSSGSYSSSSAVNRQPLR